MRAVVQRVSNASVSINGETTASIGPGLLVLAAVGRDDLPADIDYTVDKIVNLRIFPDADWPIRPLSAGRWWQPPRRKSVHPLRRHPEGTPSVVHRGRRP